MRVKEKQNFSNKHSWCYFSMTFHEATVAPSGILHKQVSYPAYTYFWLPLTFSFSHATGSQGTLPPLPLTFTTRTATIPQPSNPVMETKVHKYKLSAFSKAVYHICKSKKIKPVTEKLQHWYKHTFNLRKKQRTFFCWCPQECSKYYSILFASSIPLSILLLSKAMCSFFSHLVTLRLFSLYDI